MTDGVEIDEAAVTAAIAALRSLATDWTDHRCSLGIHGVGTGVRDVADGATDAWIAELTTAGTAAEQLASSVQADFDAFCALDSQMASRPGRSDRNVPV